MELTIQEAEDAGYSTFEYNAGGFSYVDDNEIEHLIIDGVEVAEGPFVYQYTDNIWEVSEHDMLSLFYKGEKACSAYHFHRTKHSTVYQALLDGKDREGRLVDVTDRTTWF